MAFFRTVSFAETMPAIAGEGVALRVPQSGDYPAWAALREQSRAFLTPWEPIWPADDLTRAAFRRRIKRYVEDQRNDLAYAFLIFRSSDDALVGGLTLANIRRGVAQAGSHRLLDRRALCPPGLHDGGGARAHPVQLRDAAAAPAGGGLHPEQHRLGRACWRRPAFTREGYARGYLCINGIWQDHLLYARLQDDPN